MRVAAAMFVSRDRRYAVPRGDELQPARAALALPYIHDGAFATDFAPDGNGRAQVNGAAGPASRRQIGIVRDIAAGGTMAIRPQFMCLRRIVAE
jgi:hypothetical protein